MIEKPIRLSAHARGYFQRRGFTAQEVETAIRNGSWKQVRDERLETDWEFSFHQEWNGKRYDTKRVRPSSSKRKTRSWWLRFTHIFIEEK